MPLTHVTAIPNQRYGRDIDRPLSAMSESAFNVQHAAHTSHPASDNVCELLGCER